MESNNLSNNMFNNAIKNQFSVLLLGFDMLAVERIKSIFKLERQATRSYHIVTPDTTNPIDVLLINHDNPLSLHKKTLLLSTTCLHAQVIIVSQGPLPFPEPHHIRGMLTASRLLSTLDRLPEPIPPKIAPKDSIATLAPVAKTYPDNSLPWKPSTPDTVIAHNATPATIAPHPKTQGYRALIVDDSFAIQTAIKLKLQSIEQITTIDFADNGESALEKTATTQYDLIFLDVMMPGIDGYETCSRLRKKIEYKKTPIIMVSGKTSPLDEVKGVMAGCTTYLSKPVDDQAFHKLSIRVLNWLADRKPVNTTPQ